jgi:ABC-2 type transport system permease protein
VTRFAGTGTLIRLALRRDRVLLPIWIAVIAGMVVSTAAAIAGLYPTAQSRIALGVMIATNPAIRVLTGPVFDPASIGGLTAWRVSNVAAILAALMSVFVTTRHARAEEEEAGRAELIGSAAVGRAALPAVATVVAAGANAVLALAIAAGLAVLGLPLPGAAALGLAIAGVGGVFAGVSALTGQLSESARRANGLAVAVLGVAFLLRAAGDALGSPVLSWLSPLGWVIRVRAFAGERWEVLGLEAVAALILMGLAGFLARRRDLGAGLVPPRSGRPDAPARLRSPLGLAWRLQRGTLAGWTAGFAIAGAVLGGLTRSIGDLVADNPQLAQLVAALGGGTAIVDTFLAAEMSLLGLVASGYGIQATLRLRAEETSGRAEPVLASAVSRSSWAASHLAVALAGVAVILLSTGAAFGLVYGAAIGEPAVQTLRLLGAAAVQIPAAWTMAGLASALFGLLPRFTALAWTALVGCLLLGQLGDLLHLHPRLQGLSPFAHVPRVPADPFAAPPLIGLAAVAAALVAAGLLAFRTRDLTTD